ncbi:LysE family translocator [Colwellia psychrerythraea]|uniref:Lysine exporter protein (LYSE/YGGA) n=1 Tax=Colwellia psychrerythraea TaxID=28229 RepID=A0A099L331_COLPS|nr:LysE family translocator [Colwellia psychrerythraea]KGJ96855.1 Lysine exporter protein (LYSE/YGGA) [Colwellia psychrerythraea]
MTLMSGIALFFAMSISALIPGPSVMAVISRSISSGAKNGLMVTLGIVIADYVFICLALTGLSTLVSLLGEFTAWLKYLGASYLLWLAYRTWQADIVLTQRVEFQSESLIANIFVGLCIGLANPKAILFYLGFFPAFIELSSIGLYEVVVILFISTIAVGGVLSAYACAGGKAGHLFKGYLARRALNRLSSSILATCGVLLVVKA